jgi:hypothetical protein
VVLAGVLVVGGAPLVARALADDSTPENAGLAQAPAGAPSVSVNAVIEIASRR